MAWENDQNRVAPFLAAFGIFGVLQAIGLAREGDGVQWDEAAAYVFVGYLASTLIISVYGLLVARRAPEPEPGSGTAPEPATA
jgi:hypothetical protein